MKIGESELDDFKGTPATSVYPMHCSIAQNAWRNDYGGVGAVHVGANR